MSVKKSLENFPEVSFIDNMSLEDIKSYYLTAMQNKYRELTGRELVMQDADPVRLLAYADCLMLYQIAQYADRAGKLGLLKYSYGDYLENIGALKGIERIEGAAAKTTLRITLSAARPGVTLIPSGTRVTAGDSLYFQTVENLEIPAGELTGEVGAECKETGTKGNGYAAGELRILVDPVAYVDSVENITATEGGADLESDENLAERIYLAPSSWSVAGPDDAYKYWVKTFDPGITDVKVYSDEPGIVEIRFILTDGVLPDDALIEAVKNFLMDADVRPLTDNVVVMAPDVQEYGIDLTYYINESDRTRAAVIQEQVQMAVNDYIAWQKEKIGRDVNPDRLLGLILKAGAKRAEVRAPTFQKITWSSLAVLSGEATVQYGGVEDD